MIIIPITWSTLCISWKYRTHIKLLIDFAKAAKINEYAKKMFLGETINWTEKRIVLHTALRNRSNNPVYVDGKGVMPKINVDFA